MKKVLIVASVISFIEWFNKENIDYLNSTLDCEVHLACNLNYMLDTDEERTKKYIKKIKNDNVILHNICFVRSPINKENIKAYKQLSKLINNNYFDLIHCHTPLASFLTRLAARKSRKKGSIVMYTCHGFHFHNSSPKINWLIYYPIEKICSRFCDYIVTINKEDFNRAKSFYAKNVKYIPGVGVDIKHIIDLKVDKTAYREKIGIPQNAFMIISIGELIERKNHEIIIKALGELKNKNIYYVICGKGILKEYLQQLL